LARASASTAYQLGPHDPVQGFGRGGNLGTNVGRLGIKEPPQFDRGELNRPELRHRLGASTRRDCHNGEKQTEGCASTHPVPACRPPRLGQSRAD
jgi:hypothetical protein